MPSVVRHGKLLRELLAIEVKKPVLIFGTMFQMNIVKDAAFQIFGRHISWSSQKINSSKSARRPVKQHTLSAGMAHFDNVSPDSFVKLFLFPSHKLCILFV